MEQADRLTAECSAIQEAVEQERNRIAADIHDGVAQQLAHSLHKLEFVQHILEKQPQVALRELERTSVLLQESLRNLRHTIFSLLPPQLEEQRFEAALQSLLTEYSCNEPQVKIEQQLDTLDLPATLGVPIFRFIQEALTNVRKHAQASSIRLRIRVLTSTLLVEISDNGRGFDCEQVMRSMQEGGSQHLGLRAMENRIAQIGGTWEIQSKRGQGTTVRARFPVNTFPSVLTSREREVLALLIEGYTNRGIAEKLSVSTETVKSHMHHIMQKMNVKDRTQAAVVATRRHWV